MVKYVFICIVLVILLYLIMIMPRLRCRKMPEGMGLLFAHRGLFDQEKIPENSLTAFRHAVEGGYGIELDAMETEDGKVVVFHDWNLQRMCQGKEKVEELTYEQLQQYSLLHSEEKIPTLEEALEVIDGKVPVIVEIKARHHIKSVCQKVQAVLDQYRGVYVVESFHPLVLFWYRRYRKDVIRGQLSTNFRKDESTGYFLLDVMLGSLMGNFISKPDFIAYNKTYKSSIGFTLNKTLFGATTFAWTIKSQEQLDDNREDFDYFIFDSFIPKDKSNMEV